MNIRTSYVGFNLPTTKSSSQKKLFIEPVSSPSPVHNRQNEPNASKNSVETLKKPFKIPLISRETNVQQKPIQAYLINASLANQAERDELRLLLGIDFFV